jgi:hypothetical protein
MRLLVAGLMCVLVVSCAANEGTTPRATPSPGFTLTGNVQSVQPGDEPETKVAIDETDGSIRIKAVERRGVDENCVDDDDTVTVFYTSRTDLAVRGDALVNKQVDIVGSAENDCTFIADSVSLHVATTSGGPGSSGPGSSGSPAPLTSPTPTTTRGPGPEGAIIDETPSVAPASP